MASTFYLIYNPTTGIACGAAMSPDGTAPVPTAERAFIPCTQQQTQQVNGSTVANGVITYTAPIRTLAQQAATALLKGLEVTTTGSLVLTAVMFPTDPATTAKIGLVVTTINATQLFPGGAATFPVIDASGAPHPMTVKEYLTVAGAISGYASMLGLIAAGNPLGATALPANSVTLAIED